jgi:hypothetical protein
MYINYLRQENSTPFGPGLALARLVASPTLGEKTGLETWTLLGLQYGPALGGQSLS